MDSIDGDVGDFPPPEEMKRLMANLNREDLSSPTFVAWPLAGQGGDAGSDSSADQPPTVLSSPTATTAPNTTNDDDPPVHDPADAAAILERSDIETQDTAAREREPVDPTTLEEVERTINDYNERTHSELQVLLRAHGWSSSEDDFEDQATVIPTRAPARTAGVVAGVAPSGHTLTALRGSVHHGSLAGVLRWVPCPTAEQVRTFRWGELAFARSPAGWDTELERLFVGNLWIGFDSAPMVNFLIDVLANLPIVGYLQGPRVFRWAQDPNIITTTETAERRFRHDQGHGHATVAFDVAVTPSAVVTALDKRVLFDVTGLWYAETLEQMQLLRAYTCGLQEMGRRARHRFLGSLPCMPLTVERVHTSVFYPRVR